MYTMVSIIRKFVFNVFGIYVYIILSKKCRYETNPAPPHFYD